MKGKLLTLGVGAALFAGVAWLGTETQGLVQDACVGLGALLGTAVLVLGFLMCVGAASALFGEPTGSPPAPARDDPEQSNSPIATLHDRRPAA